MGLYLTRLITYILQWDSAISSNIIFLLSFSFLIDVAVYIGFETAEYSFLENVGSFMINLMKTGSSEIDVTVTFTTSDSTAQGI